MNSIGDRNYIFSITENQKKQSGHAAWCSQICAKFKIRFHIVSKALKTGFIIFCMRNKAKQKRWLEIPQDSNADFLNLRHKKALKVNFVIIPFIKVLFLFFLCWVLTWPFRQSLFLFLQPPFVGSQRLETW